MVGAGLLAKKAVERGLALEAVGEDLARARARPSSPTTSRRRGLDEYLDKLGFNLVGYGCTTCIGNSGPLPGGDLGGGRTRTTSSSARCSRATATSRAGSTRTSATTTSPRRRSASPTRSPAGWTSTSLNDAIGEDSRRRAGLPLRHLAELRGDQGDRRRRGPPGHVRDAPTPTCSPATSAGATSTRPTATATRGPTRPTSASRASSRAWTPEPAPVEPIEGARVLAVLGDSVTTDHISPGRRDQEGLAGRPSGWSRTASSPASSTPTARAAATTR